MSRVGDHDHTDHHHPPPRRIWDARAEWHDSGLEERSVFLAVRIGAEGRRTAMRDGERPAAGGD